MQQMDEHSNKNRLKVVLAEQNKVANGLFFSWEKPKILFLVGCETSTSQQLFDIAKILNVDVKELLNSNKE